MNHQYYNVLGVMSGTSLDGIDIAHIELRREIGWHFTIKETQCIPYPNNLLHKLKEAITYNDLLIHTLDIEYTAFLGKSINEFLGTFKIHNLVAICSHGHTIKHQPHLGHTLQIGNLKELATITGHRVVCDFRTNDVALGGQGAPLVPIGDRLLFSDYEYCLNLGGFANVSFNTNGARIAYDLSPVNVVLNQYAQKLGKEYDNKGAFAKAGTINTTILSKLNALGYYHLDHPKSLGVEWVAQHIPPILSEMSDPKDVLATFTEHAAVQIAHHLKGNGKVLCTGGGCYNSYLIEKIKQLTNCKLIVPDNELIEYKEALIFAFLGVLKLRNANNCLSSVTGAVKDHSSGTIFLP
jgi:anhydro-N-acetylmuramic acid kinase